MSLDMIRLDAVCRSAMRFDEFKESEHPRGQPGNVGQFGPGGGKSKLPEKPDIGDVKEKHHQAQLDKLESFAINGEWKKLAEYPLSGTSDLAKAKIKYKRDLLAHHRAAEPKAAEPKAAEPKAAEPKAAEPKTAEPKAAEPKAAEPKAADPKARLTDIGGIQGDGTKPVVRKLISYAVEGIDENHWNHIRNKVPRFRVFSDSVIDAEKYGVTGGYQITAVMSPKSGNIDIRIANTVDGFPISDASGIFAHEFGHAIDYTTGWKLSKEFAPLIAEESSRMTASERNVAKYVLSSPAEMFAEMYRAAYSIGGEAFGLEDIERVKRIFPKSINKMRRLKF